MRVKNLICALLVLVFNEDATDGVCNASCCIALEYAIGLTNDEEPKQLIDVSGVTNAHRRIFVKNEDEEGARRDLFTLQR